MLDVLAAYGMMVLVLLALSWFRESDDALSEQIETVVFGPAAFLLPVILIAAASYAVNQLLNH